MTEEATRYLDVVYGKDMLPKVYDNRIALLKEIGKLKGWKQHKGIYYRSTKCP